MFFSSSFLNHLQNFRNIFNTQTVRFTFYKDSWSIILLKCEETKDRRKKGDFNFITTGHRSICITWWTRKNRKKNTEFIHCLHMMHICRCVDMITINNDVILVSAYGNCSHQISIILTEYFKKWKWKPFWIYMRRDRHCYSLFKRLMTMKLILQAIPLVEKVKLTKKSVESEYRWLKFKILYWRKSQNSIENMLAFKSDMLYFIDLILTLQSINQSVNRSCLIWETIFTMFILFDQITFIKSM